MTKTCYFTLFLGFGCHIGVDNLHVESSVMDPRSELQPHVTSVLGDILVKVSQGKRFRAQHLVCIPLFPSLFLPRCPLLSKIAQMSVPCQSRNLRMTPWVSLSVIIQPITNPAVGT